MSQSTPHNDRPDKAKMNQALPRLPTQQPTPSHVTLRWTPTRMKGDRISRRGLAFTPRAIPSQYRQRIKPGYRNPDVRLREAELSAGVLRLNGSGRRTLPSAADRERIVRAALPAVHPESPFPTLVPWHHHDNDPVKGPIGAPDEKRDQLQYPSATVPPS